MRDIRSALQEPKFAVAALMAVILALGAVFWYIGSSEGDKFTELGTSLFTGAVVGLGLIVVEQFMSRSAAKRQEAADEERRFTETLLRMDDLTGVRLRGRVLSGVMMPGRSLDGADLTDATLDRADFRRASMTRVVLEGARASNATFADANLRGAQGPGFTAVGSSFDRANCTESQWTKGRFQDCSLVEARLFRAALDGATFASSQMKKADLGRAEGADVVFSQTDLRASSFAGARLTRPDFSEADLRGADLSGAVFNEPDLRGADLRDCLGAESALRNPLTDSQTRMPEPTEFASPVVH